MELMFLLIWDIFLAYSESIGIAVRPRCKGRLPVGCKLLSLMPIGYKVIGDDFLELREGQTV